MYTKEQLLALPVVIHDDWDLPSIMSDFQTALEEGKDDGLLILYASYTYECYEGDAVVVGYRPSTGLFFYVEGGHCSCYGLEGQWEETSLTVEEVNEFYQRGHRAITNWINEGEANARTT